jgi:hypothetical protein
MSDAVDFIKIRNYAGTPAEAMAYFEVFQGIGGGDATQTAAPVTTLPVTTKPGITPDGQDGIPGDVWKAEQRLVEKCTRYLARFIGVSKNEEFEALLEQYIELLAALSKGDASWEAFRNVQTLLQDLEPLWNLRDRDPSPDEQKWITDFSAWGTAFDTWLGKAMDARTATLVAEDALTEATTGDAFTTAQTNLATAKAAEAQADANLPAVIIPELPALIRGGLILISTGDFSALVPVLIRIAVNVGVTYLVKWIERLRQTEKGAITRDDWNNLISAVHALQYNDEELDYGAFRVYLRSKILSF